MENYMYSEEIDSSKKKKITKQNENEIEIDKKENEKEKNKTDTKKKRSFLIEIFESIHWEILLWVIHVWINPCEKEKTRKLKF